MPRREKVTEADVVGLKHFKKLLPVLAPLHDVGCESDRAGNRRLFFDQYCALILLYLFNPVVSSLRAIQQASELKKVQKKLGCSRASLGSLSESGRVFDPDRLREVIGHLADQLKPIGRNTRLSEVKHILTLVDGTLLQALPQITAAMWLDEAHRAFRLLYCAIIACILISLWTGRKPTLRTYEMISYYFMGLADEEELIAHIEKLRRHEAN